MKKMIKVFFVFICLMLFVGCSNSQKPADQQTKSETTNIKKIDNTQTKYKRYKLNEIGKTGNYQLKTTGYNEINEIVGATKKFSTSNKYIIVNIEIAANDNALDYGYGAIDFKMADTEGKSYNCSSDETIGLNVLNKNKDNSYVETYGSLNPNVFKKTQIVFEVPKDTKPSVLVNKNDGSKDYVEYELQ